MAAGCGLFSSNTEPLPGVYTSSEFRVQTTQGDVADVGDQGATLTMTLTEEGRVTDGRLTVPAGVERGTSCAGEDFSGSYERHGDRVTFAFDGAALSGDCFGTGTPLSEVRWTFFDEDGFLRTAGDAYVLFLEKTGAGSEK